MERRNFFTLMGTGTLTALAVVPLVTNALEVSSEPKQESVLKGEKIQHMVIFNLIHEKNSQSFSKLILRPVN